MNFLSDIKNISFIPYGKLFEFIYFCKDKNHLELKPFTFSSNTKDRIALLFHGYWGSASDLKYLANFLKNHIKIGLNQTKYSHILIYQYNTIPSIKDIALQLNRDLEGLTTINQSIDIYAHSMSGLVSRFWIEQLGGGKFVRNLITFGTPHAGIPLGKYEKMIHLLQEKLPLTFSLKDLLSIKSKESIDDNPFLRHLNEFPSEFADQVHYYTLAGNSSQGFQAFGGAILPSLLSSIEKDIDGLVHTSSAHSLHLESKSFSWKQIPAQRATLELNHLEIIGFVYSNKNNLLIPEYEKLPFVQLQKWASEWK